MSLTSKFKKASACDWHGAGCVEVAMQERAIFVRDSKNPEQPALKFTEKEWDAFIKGVKAGEFDI